MADRRGAQGELPAGRPKAWVDIAFSSAATADAAYAELLREGYSHLLGVSRASLRAAAEAGPPPVRQ